MDPRMQWHASNMQVHATLMIHTTHIHDIHAHSKHGSKLWYQMKGKDEPRKSSENQYAPSVSYIFLLNQIQYLGTNTYY